MVHLLLVKQPMKYNLLVHLLNGILFSSTTLSLGSFRCLREKPGCQMPWNLLIINSRNSITKHLKCWYAFGGGEMVLMLQPWYGWLITLCFWWNPVASLYSGYFSWEWYLQIEKMRNSSYCSGGTHTHFVGRVGKPGLSICSESVLMHVNLYLWKLDMNNLIDMDILVVVLDNVFTMIEVVYPRLNWMFQRCL